jgi:peptidoglycan/LPS O-acetylase OafA/YrhL
MPEYRADIDGLRAIAILPVVFFHAGFGFAQGGFVGVDVFFVISGYLVRFYERRVRRLFPALFATTLFSSNIFFWLEAGDFDVAAERKPLLHTWSQAAEEQFHLLFPIFLLLALRYLPRRLVTVPTRSPKRSGLPSSDAVV